MKISLCLIVWNELEGCKIDIPKIPRDEFTEIFAVDGGSTDGTVEYLRSQMIPVHKQLKKGLNAAYVLANELSSCEAVVVYFPKGTARTDDLRKFRHLFEKGYQLVIASRLIVGAVNEEDAAHWRPRKWAVLGAAVLASIVWRREGYWVRDVLHGFKGWSRVAFTRMKVLDHGLSIDLEMVIRSYKLNIKRMEFPTVEIPRQYGETHFRIWPTGKKLLAYLWLELFRSD
jgi:glycosyltransferase involved in cell wall biosynthesis